MTLRLVAVRASGSALAVGRVNLVDPFEYSGIIESKITTYLFLYCIVTYVIWLVSRLYNLCNYSREFAARPAL